MQGFVDAISRRLRRNIVAIVTGDQGGAPVPTALPVAMVMGVLTDPVAYMPPNPSNVIERDSVDSDISRSPPVPVFTPPISQMLTASCYDTGKIYI